MIFLDPDLDSDQSPKVNLKRSAAPAPRAHPPSNRIPSARALARFLREAQTVVKLRGQVTVLLTTDKAIRRLNRRFRGKNKATDVLSFPAAKPSQVSKARPFGKLRAGSGAPSRIVIAGDLAISVDTARKQAAGLGHTLAVEIKVLMLHGLLHLAGYDHETDGGQMARREEKLRAKLRLPHGLIERAEAAGSGALSSPTHSAVKLRNGWGTRPSYKNGKESRA
jgi:probable rRNA maturation factor